MINDENLIRVFVIHHSPSVRIKYLIDYDRSI